MIRLAAAVAAAALLVAPVAVPGASSAVVAGSAGIATGLPLTPSAVTDSVSSGPFAGLSVTVNQTADLVNQAVSVTWKGAAPTYSSAPGTFAGNDYAADYFQVFQCWSDGSTTQPTPQQCEFGGENVNQSAYPVVGLSNAYDRVLAQPGWSDFAAEQAAAGADPSCTTSACSAYLDPNSGLVLDPFDAVDGTVVPASVDYNYANFQPYKPYDTNPYFSYTTTNEVDFARTYANGTGSALFQVDTGEQAPGLGCGEQAVPGKKTPQCWLVVVPRGTPAQDNDADDPDQTTVDTSPLSPSAWQHRIAVPLSFDPVGSACSISAKAIYIQGGEPSAPAVGNWQPELCGTSGSVAYDYESGPEQNGRLAVLSGSTTGAGMAVVNQPIPASQVSRSDPVRYAPLTASGITIAFNVERVPALGSDGQPLASEEPIAGSRVATINLTPRLVAKLLTESYQDQFFGGETTASNYTWLAHNPSSLLSDPDFLQYNPEFADLQAVQQWDNGTLIVESPTSDEAAELWSWVLADPAARAWLDGTADPWGMRVNPYYSLNPALNPAKASIDDPTLDSYPKDDPYCWKPPDTPSYTILTGQPARSLCFSDWSPYVASAAAAAQAALAANDGGKTTFNQGVTDPNAAWSANGPQVVGQTFVLAVTDTADAARYGLQTASLSAAGDDGASPHFVAPTAASLAAGVKAMRPSAVAGVAQPDVSATAAGAYPLPVLSYAAIAPDRLPAAERTAYAKFLEYAAGAGQTAGVTPGDLPAGYVPLTTAERSQTRATAADVLHPASRGGGHPSSGAHPSGHRGGSAATGGGHRAGGHALTTGAGTVAAAGGAPAAGTATTAGSGPATARTAPRRSRGPTGPSRGAAPVATVPVASSRPVAAGTTPGTPVGAERFAVPACLVAGVAALAAVPLSGRRRRRRRAAPATGGAA